MHNQAKQENIPTPARLADNLIGSIGGLTAVDRAELRRQVVMLINHSYALGYAAGSGVGIVTRMRSRLSRAYRGIVEDIKLALSAIRERWIMIFRDNEPSSRKMLAPALVLEYPARGQYLMRGGMITDAVPIKRLRPGSAPALLAPPPGSAPALLTPPPGSAPALLTPPEDWRPRNQSGRLHADVPEQLRRKAPQGAPSQFRVTRDLGYAAAIPSRRDSQPSTSFAA